MTGPNSPIVAPPTSIRRAVTASGPRSAKVLCSAVETTWGASDGPEISTTAALMFVPPRSSPRKRSMFTRGGSLPE